jgi:hypothetical protein
VNKPKEDFFFELLDGTDGFSESLVNKYQSTLRNVAEDGRSLFNKILLKFSLLRLTPGRY